jgi:glutathione synthase/RimK-type ligase-like ATP-grasp enzyme
MDKRILIVTKLNDEHAHLIATGLEMMGATPSIFRFGMMPVHETHTISLGDKATFYVDGAALLDEDIPYDRVWLRRIGGSSVKLLDVQESDKAYVSNIMTAYRASLFAFLDRLAAQRPGVMVNGYWGKLAAESKVLQLWQARIVGLSVPATLQSNDVEAIRSFQDGHGGRIICKPLIPQMWQGEDSLAFAYTSIMPPVASLPAEALSLHPAIYQPYVEKAFEARVIIFGGRQFGIKIDSQSDPLSVIDWRGKRLLKDNNDNYRLPPEVFDQCQDLMRALGISYGAFDFIVTPAGEHVFLEVNEAGQFLFVEDCAPGDKIAHAFCHFLIHGTLQDWNDKDVTFTLKDLLSSAGALARKQADSRYRDHDRTSRISRMDNLVGSHYVSEAR